MKIGEPEALSDLRFVRYRQAFAYWLFRLVGASRSRFTARIPTRAASVFDQSEGSRVYSQRTRGRCSEVPDLGTPHRPLTFKRVCSRNRRPKPNGSVAMSAFWTIPRQQLVILRSR